MTREEAINYFKCGIKTNLHLKEKDKYAVEIANENIEAYNMAISALSDYEKIQEISLDLAFENDELINKSRWIPVSERLPEMGVRVLCACQADLYDVLKLTPNGWFYDTRHTYRLGFVRAWQPLPEPYNTEIK